MQVQAVFHDQSWLILGSDANFRVLVENLQTQDLVSLIKLFNAEYIDKVRLTWILNFRINNLIGVH